MNPKVSVIVPIYNVEKYLPMCIESLVNQTLQDMEIILVNDCSPDNSLAIINDYKKKYPEKIVVINSDINRCQGGARNLGIQKAQGEYIGFVDGDDFVNINMFEKMYEAAVSSNAERVCVQGERVFDVGGGMEYSGVPYVEWRKELFFLNGRILEDTDREKLMVYPIGGVGMSLFKKELVLNSNVRFPEHRRYEDNYWGTLLCAYVKKIYFIQERLYYYRLNLNSTTNANNQLYHFDRLSIEEDLQEEFKNRGYDKLYKNALEYIYITRYYHNTFFILMEKFDHMRWDLIKRMKMSLKSKYPFWKKNLYFTLLFDKKMQERHIVIYDYPRLAYIWFKIIRPMLSKGKAIAFKLKTIVFGKKVMKKC